MMFGLMAAKAKSHHEKEKAPWITYRPQIKVLDCTIRDGGLINDHKFDDTLVKAVYQTCIDAGVDYMEIGYKASKKQFAVGEYGDWKFSDEDAIRRIVGDNPTPLKLSVMADAGKSDWREDIIPKDKSVLSMIRVAFYIHQIPEAVEMIKHSHDMGYEVSANLMAISRVQDEELEEALEVLAQTPASVIVVVDSNGAFYTEQIERLVKKFRKYGDLAGKEVGIHAHNNLQLAFANTIEAIIHGANRLDATMYGLGRGAGNCPMELLLGFLRNPKFHVRPIYKILQDHMLALREKMEWGPLVPYMIAGQLNQHPRAAMACRESPDKDKFVAFYDKSVTEE
jgi:4-hydroxy 2-oxovalerate aldolase